MEQIEKNQVIFQEDLEQVKGNIELMKEDMSQVLLTLKNIMARQDEIRKVAFEEVAQTIGASSGHQPRYEHESNTKKKIAAQQETIMTEGFVPPPPKVGASHTL